MKSFKKHRLSLNSLGLFLMGIAICAARSGCLVLIGEPNPPKCLLDE